MYPRFKHELETDGQLCSRYWDLLFWLQSQNINCWLTHALKIVLLLNHALQTQQAEQFQVSTIKTQKANVGFLVWSTCVTDPSKYIKTVTWTTSIQESLGLTCFKHRAMRDGTVFNMRQPWVCFIMTQPVSVVLDKWDAEKKERKKSSRTQTCLFCVCALQIWGTSEQKQTKCSTWPK